MTDKPALRLLLYDRTCTGGRMPLGLTHTWMVGQHLYAGLGRIDRAFGAATWAEALDWLGSVGGERQISEVQYWGHGHWGSVEIGGEGLTRDALDPTNPHRPGLERLRERLTGDALLWFRTCDAFGARKGHDFAMAWADFMGCDIAGHTFVIGLWQSGLHRISPGQAAHWPDDEGVREGTAAEPKRSTWSGPLKPNTISFLGGRIPKGW